MHDDMQRVCYCAETMQCNHHHCAGAVECMWLDKPRSAVVDVLYQLTINSSVEAGFKKEYFAPETGQQSAMQRNMRHLLALCITGMKVSRNYDKNGCALQLLEADGLIELHEDTSYTGKQFRLSSGHAVEQHLRSKGMWNGKAPATTSVLQSCSVHLCDVCLLCLSAVSLHVPSVSSPHHCRGLQAKLSTLRPHQEAQCCCG
jgi:hypothetical protein